MQSSPYLEEVDEPDDGSVLHGNDKYEGYCVDLSRKLFEMLEMDYELRLVGDGKYGGRLKNGTWDGMVGELTSGVRRVNLTTVGQIKYVTNGRIAILSRLAAANGFVRP